MIKVNFNSYASYKTDSVYQWEKDRMLEITGVDVSVIPEIHFSNSAMGKAISRQGEIKNGVITVKIPNSLLQYPLRIDVHIGVYSGNEFKVIEKVEIPVIPRERPEDYTIEISDDEVYSFKTLENMISTKADNARVNNILAGGTNIPGYNLLEFYDVRELNLVGSDHSNYFYFRSNTFESVDITKYDDVIVLYHGCAQSTNDTSNPKLISYNTTGVKSHLEKKSSSWDMGLIIDDVNTEYPYIYQKIILAYKVSPSTELIDIRVGADGKTYDSAGTAIREQISNVGHKLSLLEKTIIPDLEVGTITNGVFEGHTGRVRFTEKIPYHKSMIILEKCENYMYGYVTYDSNGVYNPIDNGWNQMIEHIEIKLTGKGLVAMNFRKLDGSTVSAEDIEILSKCVKIISYDMRDELRTAINSVEIEHGRKNGASYVFARIPHETNEGIAIRPRVALTEKKSALQFARENDSVFTVNAGLFNTSTIEPVGQTIINGIVKNSSPMVDDNGVAISDIECYPLCIDSDGMLSAPYPRNINVDKMLTDGVVHSIVGWGKLLDNFAICSEDIEAEIVHPGNYIRQCIGQFQNGDYCVLTVDQSRGSVENEAGLTYEDCAQILIDKGVKFAYSLDGGGSTETVIGMRQINPIYEGEFGRAVPTVIVFDLN